MYQTNNLHVVDTVPLFAPDTLKAEFAMTEQASNVVFVARDQIRDVLHGRDSRLLAIVGPCSIHDPDAARDYAERLVSEGKAYRCFCTQEELEAERAQAAAEQAATRRATRKTILRIILCGVTTSSATQERIVIRAVTG